MELISPAFFLYAFLTSPLSSSAPSISLSSPKTLLAALFLTHYMNRAIVCPLRTPSRSKSHIIVLLSGISFNTINGLLMGTYLSAPASTAFISPSRTYDSPIFCLGVGLWALGFAGNIIHDEILLNIRRRAKATGKSSKLKGEHYAIPHGLLYSYVSFPNYFCEWVEWFGFALAAGPIPLTLFSDLRAALSGTGGTFAPLLTPPWIFFLSEILTMLPRAYRGHVWYKKKFGEAYPKERKVVVPFVF